MANEYDSQGRLVLKDSQGTEISMYRFFQLSLKPPSGGYAYPGRTSTKYGNETHNGYDFPCTRRTEIRSTCEGTVAVVRGGITQEGNSSDNGGMGNAVIIQEEGTDRHHRYMHMIEDPVVNEGDKVYQGTLLGYSGSTGDSTGPHLHYDIQNGLWGSFLDAWEQFSNSSQPTDWTPRKVTDASEAARQDWSCIEDTHGIDYGGNSGSEEIPEFFTDKYIHDVAVHNSTFIGSTVLNECGGLIIRIGWAGTGDSANNYEIDSQLSNFLATYHDKPLGFYVYSYTAYGTSATPNYKALLDNLQTVLKQYGRTASDIELGIWYDMEESANYGSDKSVNFQQFRDFEATVKPYGYRIIGIYTGQSNLDNQFNAVDLQDVPIWIAWWDVERSTVDSFVSSKSWNKVYIWQCFGDAHKEMDAEGNYKSLDTDLMLKAIPGSGSSSNPSGPTQTIINAKKIIFDPTPGLINKDTLISITTDVENGVVRYTADNSAPTPESTILEAGHKIAPWLVPHRSWNFRAAVFDEATGEILAQGTGTYIWAWERPKGEDVEGILKHITEEKNLQPYLSYHPEDDSVETIESYEGNQETSNAE